MTTTANHARSGKLKSSKGWFWNGRGTGWRERRKISLCYLVPGEPE